MKKLKELGKQSFLYPLFLKARATYKRLYRNYELSVFSKNNLMVLDKFNKCMSDNNITYTLIYGSLLGAYRDKKWLANDCDIDTMIQIENYGPHIGKCLRKYGFKLLRSYSVDNGEKGLEETYVMKKIRIDIFYLYPPMKDDKLPYCCDFGNMPGCITRKESIKKYGGLQTYKQFFPKPTGIKMVEFEGLMLPIPNNADEILKCVYGEDYMIPNPYWDVNNKDKYREICDDIAEYHSY